MPWLQVNGDRVYYDSIVKARSHAVAVLEGVHKSRPMWYSPSIGVPIYAKAKSRSPIECVKYRNGTGGPLDCVRYGHYGADARAMYKNGKLM